MFCDVAIVPTRLLMNYKLPDNIIMELAGKLKVQRRQDILAAMWTPYMKELETMCTDATCYENENAESLMTPRERGDLEIITKMCRQQKNHFRSGSGRESIPDRIVSVSRPYVRPIVRGKEVKSVEFGAKVNNILVDGISFIEKL